MFENSILEQLASFYDNLFSSYQLGFRKGHSAQQWVIVNNILCSFEFEKMSVDNKETFEVFLMDLSKAFDFVDHDLLVTKLHAYGSDKPSLKLT